MGHGEQTRQQVRSESQGLEPVDARPRREAAFHDAWRAVRVVEASVATWGGSEQGAVRGRIAAVVHLGRLVPADVEVQVLAPPESGLRSAASSKRLWVSQPYANGAFLFEAELHWPGGARFGAPTLQIAPSCYWRGTSASPLTVQAPVRLAERSRD